MGSACCWNGRKLILTADHVVEGAGPKDIEFCTRASSPINWGARPSTPQFVHPAKMRVDEIVRSKALDLACLLLAPDQTFGMVEFLDLPAGFGPVPPHGMGTLITGCPVDQNSPVGAWRQGPGPLLVALAAAPRGCWATVEGTAPKYLPSSFAAEKHFLLNYDPAEEGHNPMGSADAGRGPAAGITIRSGQRILSWSAFRYLGTGRRT